MQDKTNVMKIPSGTNRRKIISVFIVLAIIVLAIAGIWFKKHSDQSKKSDPNKVVAAIVDNELKAKDYKSYQLRLDTDAADYIGKADYKNAEKTLNTVVKNVPTDKIISQTYATYWTLYSKTGDTQNRKKYASLTAQKLRAEGNGAAATAYEQDAK